MAIQKPDGRQYPLVAIVDIVQGADFLSGVGGAVIELPQNSVVTGGQLIVDIAFDSATSDTGEVGDVTTADRYLGSVNLQTPGSTPIVPTGFQTTDVQTDIFFENTEVSTAGTAGRARLVIEYYVDERRNENQGDAPEFVG